LDTYLDFTAPTLAVVVQFTKVATMPSLFSFRMLIFLFSFVAPILAQSATSSATVPPTSSTTRKPVTNGTTSRTTTSPDVATTSTPPDVYLNVPELHVGRIELIVEELQADINLNAKVAGLVTINAGVQVSVQKINITIADVDVQLELVVRLGHLVDIVERVFESLDLNPLLIGLVNNVTSLVGDVIGAVDGLLGSITQGGTTLNFLVDNLGNLVFMPAYSILEAVLTIRIGSRNRWGSYRFIVQHRWKLQAK
jgi:hypothetical protein